MIALWIALGVAAGAILVTLLAAFICYIRVFYSPPRVKSDEIPTPPGEEYDPYREGMKEWVLKVRAIPHDDIEIESRDGLKLRAKYYEHSEGAPIEIMLHGYRGNSERDMSAGVLRAFKLGRSVLLIDLRGSGESEGRTVSFGILERDDCLLWVDYLVSRFGNSRPIILTGISMGAATVMSCSCADLPPCVVGVLADCGFSSAKLIIKKVVSEMGLPADILYPFIKLGARIFGGFDLDGLTPLEAVKSARVPIFFTHGDVDNFVPCNMSVDCHAACASEKELFIVEGAGHGLCYPVANERYLERIDKFFAQYIEKHRESQSN